MVGLVSGQASVRVVHGAVGQYATPKDAIWASRGVRVFQKKCCAVGGRCVSSVWRLLLGSGEQILKACSFAVSSQESHFQQPKRDGLRTR